MLVIDASAVGKFVCERTHATYVEGSGQGLGWVKDGRLVAGVLYTDFNGRSVCIHVAADGEHWLRRDYLRVWFDYPFNQLHVRKLLGVVDSDNAKCRRMCEHTGFQLEAVLADAGRVGDLLVYSMTREQCRWLRGNDHGKIERTTGTGLRGVGAGHGRGQLGQRPSTDDGEPRRYVHALRQPDVYERAHV